MGLFGFLNVCGITIGQAISCKSDSISSMEKEIMDDAIRELENLESANDSSDKKDTAEVVNE